MAGHHRTRRSVAVAAITLAATLCVAPARGGRVIEAVAHRADGWLVVDVRTADLLDERTRSTVESGLPGSCVLQVELRHQSGEVVGARVIERSLEVDLWDDVVRLLEGEHERTFTSMAAADSAWSRFDALRLVRLDRLRARDAYRLRVRVHVQPLAPEDRERVSRWISDAARDDRRELSIDLGGLVGRFMGSGDQGEEAASWQGASFVPADLDDRGGRR